jgi:Flp pilus assembly protein TadG
MAVLAPLLLMILFGIIEFGWMFMVHETITTAARECARIAMLPGATDAEVYDAFEKAMTPTNVTVDSSMLTIKHATEADPVVTISISVPYSDVTVTGLTSFLNIKRSTLGSTCSMTKEGMM